MKQALLLYGATEIGSSHFSGDILWRTGFKAPDPFFVVEVEGRVYLITSSLEFGRALKESKADEVVLLENSLNDAGNKTGGIQSFLKRHKVEKVIVPDSLPYILGKMLESRFRVEVRKQPFYPKRARKTDREIREIEKAQRAVEHALDSAIKFLAGCKIHGHDIVRHSNEISSSSPYTVTAEMVRAIIDQDLYAQGYLGVDTIVASGIQAVDPHCVGFGPLIAYQPIVIDVFPLSLETHYYADQTRTVFKGEPSPKFKNMYEAVLGAQTRAIEMIKAGADGYTIWEYVTKFFEKAGYPTNISTQPLGGFIHGLGHGVGIEIHEAPRMGGAGEVLEERNVVTVEPGLYYSQPKGQTPIGGIRIEDMVEVTKDGCRNLTLFPKKLEDMIIP